MCFHAWFWPTGRHIDPLKATEQPLPAPGIGYNDNMFTRDYKSLLFRNKLTDGEGRVYYDFNELPVSGVSLQMGLPISADFKFRNDAFLRKNVRFGTTFGTGVLPSLR